MAQRHNDFIQALTSGSAPIGPGVMGLDQATMDAINFENIKSAINRNINSDPQGDIRTFNVNDEYSDSELMESDTTSKSNRGILDVLKFLGQGALGFATDIPFIGQGITGLTPGAGTVQIAPTQAEQASGASPLMTALGLGLAGADIYGRIFKPQNVLKIG